MTRSKYLLFGTAGGNTEYLVHSDDLELLKKEAARRLMEGYSASLLDRETDQVIHYSLLEEIYDK